MYLSSAEILMLNFDQTFFTTKPVGRGTELGLSISKGIVEGYGGQLTYDSESKYTRFFVRLPMKQVTSKVA